MIRAYDEYGNIIDLVEWENNIRTKAIDDFAKKLKYEYGSDEIHETIDEIAERLKVGTNNGAD